jgi:hypothetical protein
LAVGVEDGGLGQASGHLSQARRNGASGQMFLYLQRS